ncbi:hypothetical protein [Myroides sp. DW712]|uniref:hypothetical protein n=1 Tax=Myroides sp. DW712 TaxID=3389800 RepID=UPI00397C4F9C
MKKLVDVVFVGNRDALLWNFITIIKPASSTIDLMYPEQKEISVSIEELKALVQSDSDYVNFTISNINRIELLGCVLSNVFADFVIDKDKVEVLLFCDVAEFEGQLPVKEKFNLLLQWMESVKINFRFDWFICKMDNGEDENDDEVYFDSWGRFGTLYTKL